MTIGIIAAATIGLLAVPEAWAAGSISATVSFGAKGGCQPGDSGACMSGTRSVPAGTTVTFIAEVYASDPKVPSPTPTGSVALRENGVMNGIATTRLEPQANGNVTWQYAPPPGQHTFYATYSGDDNYQPAESEIWIVDVDEPTTTTTEAPAAAVTPAARTATNKATSASASSSRETTTTTVVESLPTTSVATIASSQQAGRAETAHEGAVTISPQRHPGSVSGWMLAGAGVSGGGVATAAIWRMHRRRAGQTSFRRSPGSSA